MGSKASAACCALNGDAQALATHNAAANGADLFIGLLNHPRATPSNRPAACAANAGHRYNTGVYYRPHQLGAPAMSTPHPEASEGGHSHVFLGADHDRSERKTWAVIVLCGVMMA